MAMKRSGDWTLTYLDGGSGQWVAYCPECGRAPDKRDIFDISAVETCDYCSWSPAAIILVGVTGSATTAAMIPTTMVWLPMAVDVRIEISHPVAS